MKKIFNIVFLLSIFCFGNTYAQNSSWTTAEITVVNNELTLIENEIPISPTQKEYLRDILLQKNADIEDGVRINHKRKIVLGDLEDVIRYGQPVNRHPGEENINELTEVISLEIFNQKILNNSALLQELNLIITEE
ncbi:hypothetical protein MG290_10105 [Flavobacterium sp. CBA20B-1]|uniref:hypothetical protein n=1 Tax=unclassified Flavobacterium TaxID=196869 RepID=UPI002224871F|nr:MULTISPECIES: hypothetical protein [unclassified Flavobacterium]WCM41308.1 hypothetical protein MG290_10105 [Flavobacterium sp. CBA20B-1]